MARSPSPYAGKPKTGGTRNAVRSIPGPGPRTGGAPAAVNRGAPSAKRGARSVGRKAQAPSGQITERTNTTSPIGVQPK